MLCQTNSIPETPFFDLWPPHAKPDSQDSRNNLFVIGRMLMTNTTSATRSVIREAGEWAPVPPLHAGPEMAALRTFLFDCVWTGDISPNGMGPGSPRMSAMGKARFSPILDGAWIACDCEQDQFIADRKVITWKAHFVVGWDPRGNSYKLLYADNNGSSTLMQGRIDDASFICETAGDDAVQLRLTWTFLGNNEVEWRNECSIDGGPWFLIENYRCTPE